MTETRTNIKQYEIQPKYRWSKNSPYIFVNVGPLLGIGTPVLSSGNRSRCFDLGTIIKLYNSRCNKMWNPVSSYFSNAVSFMLCERMKTCNWWVVHNKSIPMEWNTTTNWVRQQQWDKAIPRKYRWQYNISPPFKPHHITLSRPKRLNTFTKFLSL